MRVLCILSMDSGIYCPREMSDVIHGEKLLMENCIHAVYARARVLSAESAARMEAREEYTFIDSNEIELRGKAFGVKPRDRAVLCKRFEIRTRQVEINREIGAVLIKSELNGIFSVPPRS